jgi:hypothetical protein
MKNKTVLLSTLAAMVIIGGAYALTTHKSKSTEGEGMIIQSHRTYSLKSDSLGKTHSVNTPSEYSFSIVDENGHVLKDYQLTHTKVLHLIVVRKDLAYFQHVHPDFDPATGIFTIKDLTFPADGQYRIFADFAATGGQMDSMGMPLTTVDSEDVAVGNSASYAPQPIGTEETTKTFGDLKVTLGTHGTPKSGTENMLMFSLSSNGKPVTDLEPYLGALGHVVVLREGNLDYIHAHPIEDVTTLQTGVVSFMVDFPEAGKYKVFTQFQRGGKVITTNFVVTVEQGAANSMEGSMSGMNAGHDKLGI